MHLDDTLGEHCDAERNRSESREQFQTAYTENNTKIRNIIWISGER